MPASIKKGRLELFPTFFSVNGYILPKPAGIAFGTVYVRGQKASTDRRVFAVASNPVDVLSVTVAGKVVEYVATVLDAVGGSFTVIELKNTASERPRVLVKGRGLYSGDLNNAVTLLRQGTRIEITPLESRQISYLISDPRLSAHKAISRLIDRAGFHRTPFRSAYSSVSDIPVGIRAQSTRIKSESARISKIVILYNKDYFDDGYLGAIEMAIGDKSGETLELRLDAVNNPSDAKRVGADLLNFRAGGLFSSTEPCVNLGLGSIVSFEEPNAYPSDKGIVTAVDPFTGAAKIISFKDTGYQPFITIEERHVDEIIKETVISGTIRVSGTSVEYRIVDSDGNPFIDADVTLEKEGSSQTFKTDKNGVIVFNAEKGDIFVATVVIDAQIAGSFRIEV